MSQDQKDVERPFVVDGIKEYDNPLPPWWVALFWMTIIYGIGYLVYVHGFDGPTLDKELMADRQQHEEVMAKANAGANEGGASIAEQMKSPELIAAGKALYVANCAACHGQLGEGIVGPNLTDPNWLHGGSAEDIIKSITDGIPAKGMIAWKAILGPKKIKETAAFIISLKGTNPPNGKAPEGDVYEGP